MVMFGLMTKGEFALWLVFVALALALSWGLYLAIRVARKPPSKAQEEGRQYKLPINKD